MCLPDALWLRAHFTQLSLFLAFSFAPSFPLFSPLSSPPLPLRQEEICTLFPNQQQITTIVMEKALDACFHSNGHALSSSVTKCPDKPSLAPFRRITRIGGGCCSGLAMGISNNGLKGRAISRRHMFGRTQVPKYLRVAADRVSLMSEGATEGPSCIFVGPLETADREMLESLYQQARDSYYNGKPLIVDDMFDKVEIRLRWYGSRVVYKYPRCSLKRFSAYSDAEVYAFLQVDKSLCPQQKTDCHVCEHPLVFRAKVERSEGQRWAYGRVYLATRSEDLFPRGTSQ